MVHLAWTLLVALLGTASGANIQIKSGERGLLFEPNSFTAKVGDTLEFLFWPQNHSVAAGDLDRPCQPLAEADGGFNSGFLPVKNGQAVSQPCPSC